MKKSHTGFWLLNILLPLLLGTAFYLLFRPETHIAVFLRSVIRIGKWDPPASGTVVHPLYLLASSFLCDILWAYALTFCVRLILHDAKSHMTLTFLICVCFELLMELLQKTRLLNGTFDTLDILLEASATVLALLIINQKEEKRRKKT